MKIEKKEKEADIVKKIKKINNEMRIAKNQIEELKKEIQLLEKNRQKRVVKYIGISNLIKKWELETIQKIKIINEGELNHRQVFVVKSAILQLLETDEIPFYEDGWEAEVFEDKILIKEAGTYNHIAKIFVAKDLYHASLEHSVFVMCLFDNKYDVFLLHVPGSLGDYIASDMYSNLSKTVIFDLNEKLFKQKEVYKNGENKSK